MTERDGGSWPVGWEESRRDQIERWRSAHPLERLEWLEQALAFALEAGALPAARSDAEDQPE